MPNIAKAITHDQNYKYDFRCEGCGSQGYLEIPKTLRQLDCPERCGASYIQWHPPNQIAALMCVVCPVFVEKRKAG